MQLRYNIRNESDAGEGSGAKQSVPLSVEEVKRFYRFSGRLAKASLTMSHDGRYHRPSGREGPHEIDIVEHCGTQRDGR